MQGDFHSCRTQALGIGAAFVVEHVAVADHDQRRRNAGDIRRQHRRDTPVVGHRHIRQQMAVEEFHRCRSQRRQAGVERARWIQAAVLARVGQRIDQQLATQGDSGIARGQCGNRGHGAADTVAADGKALHIGADRVRVRNQPMQGRDDIFHTGRRRVLGGQTVMDRQHLTASARCQLPTHIVMGLQIADQTAAAVHV